MNELVDNVGQMIFGDRGGLKIPDICLTGEEKPRKKPHPGNLSRPGIEPGLAAWQARMLLPDPEWIRDLNTTYFIKGNLRSIDNIYTFVSCEKNNNNNEAIPFDV